MSLRDAARQAWLNDQQSSETEARNALVAVLGDQLLVDGLITLHVEVGDTFVRWFFQDTEGITLRAARRSTDGVWVINYVTEETPGTWIDQGSVTSLKQLWELLPIADVIKEWVAEEEVVPGDIRSYLGITYECLKGHTTKVGREPPNDTSVWEVVS